MGIVQSNFLPWRGYFDLIRESDLFIIHDNLQYTKGDWRNRNRIKTPRGAQWITVPVSYRHTSQLIEQTPIDYSAPWAQRMLGRIRESYRRAPCFDLYFFELHELLARPAASISELNLRLIAWACRHLGIDTPIRMSHEYDCRGTKTERLIGILRQAAATCYLSGPAARAYLIPESFERAGILLEYKRYDYAPYEQLYPPFEPSVSVIDLLFMKGPEAKNYLDGKGVGGDQTRPGRGP
ncbi:MAG TPA: WbqC family protein [Burkholderiales bacterium]|nr:WbqC family protein [Burkholderiales bacterium]